MLTGTNDPSPILDRFLSAVKELALDHERSITGHITISCGCVVLDGGVDVSPTQLLKESDEALYEAKMAGRNRYVVRFPSR